MFAVNLLFSAILIIINILYIYFVNPSNILIRYFQFLIKVRLKIRFFKLYLMEEEESLISWEFTNIFKSNDSRIVCVMDVLEAFENFPPDTRLNCDDYYSLLSVFCENIPYPFIVFVCECVDPSISSGTLLSHRIAFGNFLLAFPCCILFPQFTHKFLTLFKTCDKLKTGIILRPLFLNILQETLQSFIKPKSEIDKEVEEEHEEEESINESGFGQPKNKKPITTIDPLKLPDFSIFDEVKRATIGLDEASVQTLFFIMWQKDPTLLHCKSRIKPEDYINIRNPPKVTKQSEEQFDKEEKPNEVENSSTQQNNESAIVNDDYNDANYEDKNQNDSHSIPDNVENEVNLKSPIEAKEEQPTELSPDLDNEENDYNSDESQDEK